MKIWWNIFNWPKQILKNDKYGPWSCVASVEMIQDDTRRSSLYIDLEIENKLFFPWSSNPGMWIKPRWMSNFLNSVSWTLGDLIKSFVLPLRLSELKIPCGKQQRILQSPHLWLAWFSNSVWVSLWYSLKLCLYEKLLFYFFYIQNRNCYIWKRFSWCWFLKTLSQDQVKERRATWRLNQQLHFILKQAGIFLVSFHI